MNKYISFDSRDGLHESNVVTKTFVVDDSGPPPDDLDSLLSEPSEVETFMDRPSTKYGLSKTQLGLAKKKKIKVPKRYRPPKEAWGDDEVIDTGHNYVTNNREEKQINSETLRE